MAQQTVVPTDTTPPLFPCTTALICRLASGTVPMPLGSCRAGLRQHVPKQCDGWDGHGRGGHFEDGDAGQPATLGWSRSLVTVLKFRSGRLVLIGSTWRRVLANRLPVSFATGRSQFE